MKQKIKTTNPHKHDDYHEIIYLSDGEGYHTIDLTTYEIVPPCLFIVKAGNVHFWEFTANPDGYVIMFRNDYLAHLASSEIVSGFEHMQKSYLNLADNEADLIHNLKQIKNENDNQHKYSDRIIASLLEVLFVRMIRSSSLSQQSRLNAMQELVNRYKKLINQHLSDIQLVKEYARLLNVTPKYLNEACKNVTDKTASQILSKSILLEAKRRLLYTTDTVTDVAYSIGFKDVSNFSSFFKRQTDITPGQFRKSML